MGGTSIYQSFLPVGPGVFEYRSERDIIVAANGDELYSQSIFTFTFFSSNEATYEGVTTFTGGTGRFEGAGGSVDVFNGYYVVTGLDDLGAPRGEFSHEGAGSISY